MCKAADHAPPPALLPLPAAANRLAMWQLQNELLADSVSPPADWPAAAAPRMPPTATVN